MPKCSCMDIFSLFPPSAAQPAPRSQVGDIPLLIQAASTAGANALRQELSKVSPVASRGLPAWTFISVTWAGPNSGCLCSYSGSHQASWHPRATGGERVEETSSSPRARPRSPSALAALGSCGCRLRQRTGTWSEPQVHFEGLNIPCEKQPYPLPHQKLT